MKNVHYNFYKDGHKYSAAGDNALAAQWKLELQFGIDLKGARYEMVLKARVLSAGTVR